MNLFVRRFAALAVPVLLGLGGAGCHTFHYYDIHAKFDPTSTASMPGFTRASAFTVQVCVVTVSGADSASFDLPHNSSMDQRCPDMRMGVDPLDAGTFEFSTFADSGTLKFTLDAYQNQAQTADCHVGSGSVSVPATSTLTTAADLPIKYLGTTCVTTGQTQGDGAIILD